MVNGEAEPAEINAVEFIVASAREKVVKLEKRIEDLSASDNDGDAEELERLLEQLDEMDPSTFEAKAGSILHGLGFSQQMMARPTKDMSGGWRMRVALARALFIKPHVLLLGMPLSYHSYSYHRIGLRLTMPQTSRLTILIWEPSSGWRRIYRHIITFS